MVYDYIGNEHPRKNLYIREVALLEKQMEETSGADRESLRKQHTELVKNRKDHPYNVRLRDFHEKEDRFNKELDEKVKSYSATLGEDLSKASRDLYALLYRNTLRNAFYKDHTELTYDAKLAYEESGIVLRLVPDVVKNVGILEAEVKAAEAGKGTFTEEQQREAKLAIAAFTDEKKAIYDAGVKRLRDKREQGIISRKALKNGLSELKKTYENAVRIKSFDDPKKGNEELIRSKRFELKNYQKVQGRVMNADIADARRRNPVEVEKKTPVIAYATALVPGLGQLLNKQPIKAALFVLALLFIYVIAIPYALGFGNYQGQGIAGLISLAEGARRIDRSIIFLIEGIIAIFLLIFALALYIISFRDVLTVERGVIRGIRPRNWFETWTAITEEGFPYLVSLPALITIVFIVLVPVTTAALLSFTGMNPQNQAKFPWVGIENYKLIALGQGLAGRVFWVIFGWTVLWTLLATTLAITLGFGLALLANNERIKGKPFFRMVFLLPWAVPAFITIMFFSIMFSPLAVLTDILSNLAGRTIDVKNNVMLTRAVLIGLQGWLGSSYIFLLSTGVLQAIPEDLYEAAQIDGASTWQKIRKITLPLVLFQTAPLLVGQYTFNFNNFSIIYLFNGGGPFNPSVYGNLAGTSDILISYIYKLTIDNQYQSIGAAITIVISMGLMVFTFFGYRNSKAFKEERL
jgi:arabinogalactan oligomer/maltooligosaccharide transport system permease protein